MTRWRLPRRSAAMRGNMTMTDEPTGYEHLSDEEFFVVAFGLDLPRTAEAVNEVRRDGEELWIKAVDPTRADDVYRELQRRGARMVHQDGEPNGPLLKGDIELSHRAAKRRQN